MNQPSQVPSAQPRVLVVDDESATRMMARAMLERRGHGVVEAADGAEALAAVRDGAPFDVVLMDVNMPGTDGLTALDAIRRLDDPARSGAAVIMLTATSDTRGDADMMDRGADAVLRKPLRWDALAPILTACLATARGETPMSEAAPAAPRQITEPSPVDRILADLPRDRARHLLERAVINLRAYHGEIAAAGRAGDAAEASRLAHKIGGVAATYGCRRLADAAVALERNAEEMSAEELAQAVAGLSAPFETEVGALDRRALELAPG